MTRRRRLAALVAAPAVIVALGLVPTSGCLLRSPDGASRPAACPELGSDEAPLLRMLTGAGLEHS